VRSTSKLRVLRCALELGPLLAAGCRIWTHPAPFNHSKLMTVDGIWCLVGSSNWDVRSFRLNFELDLEVYDPELACQIDGLISAQQGRRISTTQLNARYASRCRTATLPKPINPIRSLLLTIPHL